MFFNMRSVQDIRSDILSVETAICLFGWLAGVPRLKEIVTSYNPTAGPCLGSYGGLRGGGLFLMSEVPL